MQFKTSCISKSSDIDIARRAIVLNSSSTIVLLTLCLSACVSPSDSAAASAAGAASLTLRDIDKTSFEIAITNKSKAEMTISTLLQPGFVQSPITYQILDLAPDQKLDREAVGMPVLVNLERYKEELSTGKTRAFRASKEEFAILFGLRRGACYRMRANYNAPSGDYVPKTLKSEVTRICF